MKRDESAFTIVKESLEQLERSSATMRAEPVEKRMFRMQKNVLGENKRDCDRTNTTPRYYRLTCPAASKKEHNFQKIRIYLIKPRKTGVCMSRFFCHAEIAK
jgi:hypothetical protein